MAIYQYFTFGPQSGDDQQVVTSENIKGMKLVNLATDVTNITELSLKAKNLAGTSFTILNKVKMPVGAVLVLDEDDLGISEATGFNLFFQMNTATGSIGVTIKY
tara:strand:+ start:456 stop:767 length:312 start_codon:yes stop_codon:yes gene_type:complete